MGSRVQGFEPKFKGTSARGRSEPPKTPWCLVGHGGMDIEDYYWGLYRGYYRDPFPNSLLGTRQKTSETTKHRNIPPPPGRKAESWTDNDVTVRYPRTNNNNFDDEDSRDNSDNDDNSDNTNED